MHQNRFRSIANIDSSVAAFGPKWRTIMSIVRKDSQDTMIPQSSASQSNGRATLLLASRFIANTDMTNNTVIAGGTDRSSSSNS